MKKVMLIIPTLGCGGAEKFVLDLAAHLDKDKYLVTVVSLYSSDYAAENRKAQIAKDGIDVVYLNKKRGLDFKCFIKMKKLIADIKPDVIHTNLSADLYLISAGAGIKNVCYIHTLHTVAKNELPLLHLSVEKHKYRKKQIIPVAISPYIRESVSSCYGLDEKEIPMVYNGVDTHRFNVNDRSYKGNDIVFVSVARFSPVKNHELMIEAFQKAMKQYPEIRLVLVGDGELLSDIKNKVNQKGLTDYVSFTGNISNVEDYLKSSDVFLISSDYEGMPLSALEAMAAGLPIVTTAAGGVIDIIDGNGITVPVKDSNALADAMLTVARSRELRKRFSERSRELSAKYDISAMAREYEKLYEASH